MSLKTSSRPGGGTSVQDQQTGFSSCLLLENRQTDRDRERFLSFLCLVDNKKPSYYPGMVGKTEIGLPLVIIHFDGIFQDKPTILRCPPYKWKVSFVENGNRGSSQMPISSMDSEIPMACLWLPEDMFVRLLNAPSY